MLVQRIVLSSCWIDHTSSSASSAFVVVYFIRPNSAAFFLDRERRFWCASFIRWTGQLIICFPIVPIVAQMIGVTFDRVGTNVTKTRWQDLKTL